MFSIVRAWDDFWLRLFVVHGCQMLRAVAVVGCVLMLKIAPGVRGVCDGLERCFCVSAVCGICGIGREGS